MKFPLKPLAGGMFGFALGWVVTSPVVLALTQTQVVWPAEGCPAGVYTITSSALHLQSGRSYQVTTKDVVLPTPNIIQQFSNLPTGAYTVSATAKHSDGRMFGPSVQTVSVWTEPGASSPVVGTSSRGHRVSPQPPSPSSRRKRANTAPPAPGADGRSTATRSSAAVPDPPETVVTPPTVPRHVPRGRLQLQLQALLRLFSDDEAVHQIEVVDLDDDDEVDLVTIEWTTGERRTWHISR